MKNILRKSAYTLASVIALASCKPEADVLKHPGRADFTKYIAIGNSITAGYSNGGTYKAGQEVAYPNLLAQQLKLADPENAGDFFTPFFTGTTGTGSLTLTGFNGSSPILVPTTPDGVIGASQFTTDVLPVESGISASDIGRAKLEKYSGEINNFGVPGIRLSDIFSTSYGVDNIDGGLPAGGYFDWNPYFERLLTEEEITEGTSYYDFVGDRGHTFFTLFLGNNDALGYAGSGGSVPLTPAATFNQLYNAMVAKLAGEGAGGVLATIPNITSLPFFTTVNGSIAAANGGSFPTLPLTAVQAAQINAAYQLAGYSNPGLVGDGTDTFVIIADDPNTQLVTEVRQMDPSTDLLLLSFSSKVTELSTGLGSIEGTTPKPIADSYVLDAEEVELVQTTIKEYNNIITNSAKAFGLGLADVYTLLEQGKTGITVNGVTSSARYISGGIFSLDGVHLTPRGNAYLANLFIEAINKKYSAQIPLVDVNNYIGVPIP